MEDRAIETPSEPTTGETAVAPTSQGTTQKPKPSSEPSSSSQQTTSSSSKTAPSSNETTTKAASAAPKSSSHNLDDANKELFQLISSGKLTTADVPAISSILKEHVTLKEKVDKLKSLLGRSAKAQRETKVDLEATQKRLNQAIREIERLNQKLDKLQSRPTHLDLLMDFETNFDKALLSVGQTGGEETSATPAKTPAYEQESALDAMLLQELGEAKARLDKLDSLNSTLLSRSKQLEGTAKTLQTERDAARDQTSRLQMELRMAQLEAEHATRAMQDKAASLEEMQLEIDLVTKANVKASARAVKGEEAANNLKSDRQRVHQLESQVQALQEWALASAEAKRLMQERCKILEMKLRQSQGRPIEEDSSEKHLFKKSGSMVIGAGDKGTAIIELGHHGAQVDTRFVVMRWKFDFSPSDLNIDFNILKGKCETTASQQKADYLIKDRVITGGAGGETEGAFNVDGACTILWSNTKSWVRPRTVKYSVEVVSLK